LVNTPESLLNKATTNRFYLPLKNINIPEEEQLEAISQGLPSFYLLLKRYLGYLDKSGDLRQYITVTKSKLIDYLRNRPELMKRHLYKKGDPRYHEFSVLEYDGINYRVYEMDHEDPWDIREYEDFAEATADYLMRDLGIYSGS
jgi:hypothetical protein